MEKINFSQTGNALSDIETLKIEISNIYARLNRKTPSLTIDTAGNVSKTIQPSIYYNFTGEITSLSITLSGEVENQLNEYMFQFISGANAPILNQIDGISWVGGIPVIQANKTYVVKISNAIAQIICV